MKLALNVCFQVQIPSLIFFLSNCLFFGHLNSFWPSHVLSLRYYYDVILDGTDPESVLKLINQFVNYGKNNKESVAELFVTLLIKVYILQIFVVHLLYTLVTASASLISRLRFLSPK